jgi:peroxiredoxin
MNGHHRVQDYSLLFFLLCVTLCSLLTSNSFSDQVEAKQCDSETFDFTLKTIDGEEVSLKDYRGEKIVHLVFWATWCPHCLMEMPKVSKLYQELQKKPYEVLAVDVGINESIKRIRKIQKKYKIPSKILLDEKGVVTKLFKIIGVPCHIIIGKDGTVLDRVNELPKDALAYMQKFLPQEDNPAPEE